MNMDNIMDRNNNKNRSRKIILFPHHRCKLSNIDIGKYFLGLIDKNFKRITLLSKITKWNNIKNSYSSTNNISRIIYNYNKNNWQTILEG